MGIESKNICPKMLWARPKGLLPVVAMGIQSKSASQKVTVMALRCTSVFFMTAGSPGQGVVRDRAIA
jgi:hypothetical protein